MCGGEQTEKNSAVVARKVDKITQIAVHTHNTLYSM